MNRKRRIDTSVDLQWATDMAASIRTELDALLEQKQMLEDKYAFLADPGEAGDPDEEGGNTGFIVAQYEKKLFRIDMLRRDLHTWANTASGVVLKQIDARHKSGELVSVAEVARHLKRVMTTIRKYGDKRHMALIEQEVRASWAEFVQANPAALLEAGADARQEEKTLDEGWTILELEEE